MPRPPFELHAMEMEERRRELADRRLRKQQRLHQDPWILGGIGLLALLILALRLAGFVG